MKRILAIAVFFACLGAVAALAAADKPSGPGPMIINVDSVMGAYIDPRVPLREEIPLGQLDTASARLLQIQHELTKRTHADHDEIFLLVRGKGDFYLGDQMRTLRRMDMVFVPRGTPHSFINTGGGSAGMIVFCTPPYDAKDQITGK
jgi:mannose-6-phosphate isomerase-like protein (cupin superfamily)